MHLYNWCVTVIAQKCGSMIASTVTSSLLDFAIISRAQAAGHHRRSWWKSWPSSGGEYGKHQATAWHKRVWCIWTVPWKSLQTNGVGAHHYVVWTGLTSLLSFNNITEVHAEYRMFQSEDLLQLWEYMKGVSKRIQKMCQWIGIKTVFSAKCKMRSLLTRAKGKPPIEQVKSVVYEVPCECGERYIEETGRILEAKLKEHKYATLALHANKHHHQILRKHIKVVEREPFWMKRKIKETLNMKRTSPGMNLDGDYQYHHIWNSIIIWLFFFHFLCNLISCSI